MPSAPLVLAPLLLAIAQPAICADGLIEPVDTVAPEPRKPAADPEPGGPGQRQGAPAGETAAPPEARPGATPANVPVDRSDWTFWWQYNRDSFVDLRSRLHAGVAHRGGDDFFLGRGQSAVSAPSRRPTDRDVRDLVAPALLHVLETERNGELVAGALLALAKIGDARSPRPLRAAILPHLRRGDTRVAEAAALALGILGDERCVPHLLALVRDDASGQALVGSAAVPVRIRSFAAYGLGLVADASADEGLHRRIATALVEIVEADRFARPDLQVAALSALGIVPLPWTSNAPIGTPAEEIARDRASLVTHLVDRLRRDPRRGGFPDVDVRAHAPTAIARLLTRGVASLPPGTTDAAHAAAMESLLAIVDRRSREPSVLVVQSATIALGELATASDRSHPRGDWNERAFTELRRLSVRTPHGQSEFFALMALAQLGSRPGPGLAPLALSAEVEDALLRALARARGPKRAWASLALGVYGSGLLESGVPVPLDVADAVRSESKRTRRPSDAGAHAVALGLLQDLGSEALLVERMERFAQADTRGYIALALGMMGATGSMEPMLQLCEASRARPDLLEPAAIGVGLLGDPVAVHRMTNLLREARGAASLRAVASALGRIGDRDALPPLVAMLGDTTTPDPSRAAAAIALGIACDRSDEPWNAKLAANVNYRTNVSTLTNELGTGILDVF